MKVENTVQNAALLAGGLARLNADARIIDAEARLVNAKAALWYLAGCSMLVIAGGVASGIALSGYSSVEEKKASITDKQASTAITAEFANALSEALGKTLPEALSKIVVTSKGTVTGTVTLADATVRLDPDSRVEMKPGVVSLAPDSKVGIDQQSPVRVDAKLETAPRSSSKQGLIAGEKRGGDTCALDPAVLVPAMQLIERGVEAETTATKNVEELFKRSVATTPPSKSLGKVQIALKWTNPIDLDLYGRLSSSSGFVFYGNPRSEEAEYPHDYTSAPDANAFEWLRFTSDAELKDIEAYVNFYKGQVSDGPEFTVRVIFEGRIYEKTLRLTATSGNGGDLPRTGAAWLRLNLPEIVGLTGGSGSGEERVDADARRSR